MTTLWGANDAQMIRDGFSSLGDILVQQGNQERNLLLAKAKNKQMQASTAFDQARTTGQNLENDYLGTDVSGMDDNQLMGHFLNGYKFGRKPGDGMVAMGQRRFLNAANAPEGPKRMDEYGARMNTAAMGNMPSDTTRMTPGYADNRANQDKAHELGMGIKLAQIAENGEMSRQKQQQAHDANNPKPLTSNNFGLFVDKDGNTVRKLLTAEMDGQRAGFAPNKETTLKEGVSPFSKKLAEKDANMYSEYEVAARGARESNLVLNRLETVIDEGMKTGKAQPGMLFLRQWGKALGMDIPEVATQEEAQAIFKRLSTEMGSRILKGSQTEREWALMEELVPQLGKSVEANKKILALMRRINNRSISIQEEMDKWIENPGGEGQRKDLRGFWKHWDDSGLAEKYGAYSGELSQAGATDKSSGSLKVGDVVDGYRWNGGDPNSKDSWEAEK